MQTIRIRGARTHNLANISLDLPRDRLIVLTGLSGSGKSSLAFDTLYAEGQRRYVESLSAYARQFLAVMDKPDVDSIEGLSPAIAIEQKSGSHNPRSTVGTVTEIYDYLRLLFARAGLPRCPRHGIDLAAQTVSQMVDQSLLAPQGELALMLAPLIDERRGEHAQLIAELAGKGFVRVRIDGTVYEIDDTPKLDPKSRHTIEAVVDRFRVRPEAAQRLAESFETAIALGNGIAEVVFPDHPALSSLLFSSRHACPECGFSVPTLEPRMFSFNNPAGACPTCDGLGSQEFFDPERVVVHPHLSLAGGAVRGWDRRNAHYFQLLQSLERHYHFDLEAPWSELPDTVQHLLLYGSGDEQIEFRYREGGGRDIRRRHAFEGIVPNLERRYRETDSQAVREELAKYLGTRACVDCGGARLNEAARSVLIDGRNLPSITHLTVGQASDYFAVLRLEGWRAEVATRIVREVRERLRFLVDVGLDYLGLDRGAGTLSGGEAQRIRLAAQLGSNLQGVCYVLDEPTIGLHPRDNVALLDTLDRLRSKGNTLIVVEHDEDTIRRADHVIDLGPGAGTRGGRLVAQGTAAELAALGNSATGRCLASPLRHSSSRRRNIDRDTPAIEIRGAVLHNLRNVAARIPLGRLTVVTGVSGSGKSTLARDVLLANLRQLLSRSTRPPEGCDSITGWQSISRVLEVDQTPIGKTPRSCPATYIGFWESIRKLYADTVEARMRGFSAGRFSFNTAGGRCEACEGQGMQRIEMSFLPDVQVLCDVCGGRRFNPETLGVLFKGKSIGETLAMSVEDALEFFAAQPNVHHPVSLLADVGLGYLSLGQPSPTLSGGESQRIKLVTELAKVRTDALGVDTARRESQHTLYVLDEPTVGLHMADVEKLLRVLHRLIDSGNTVVVIEHNLDVMAEADWIVDLGPDGGTGGGRIVAQGVPEAIARRPGKSHTARILGGFLAERGIT
jgi:excinuclease ABC subunit A